MRMRAIQAGCVSNPYRFVEAGQEFDYHEPLKWAIPIGTLEPGAATAVLDETGAPVVRKGRKKAAEPVADADPVADEDII